MKKILQNDRGDLSFTTCFVVAAMVMLTSFVLLYFSVQINCINIRNGVKMELNNLMASIYADTYHAQREIDMEEYIRTLYSSSSYTRQLEQFVEDGIGDKVPLETEDYRLRNIHLEFSQDGNDRITYIFTCDAAFYVTMFGNRYPAIVKKIRLTGSHNTKF